MKIISDVSHFSTIFSGGPQAAEGADKQTTQAVLVSAELFFFFFHVFSFHNT